MKKLLAQGITLILLFIILWFCLSKIDWINIFKVQKVANTTEQKLGEIFWNTIKNSEKENKNIHVINSIDSIVTKVCKLNNIDREEIKIHLLNKDEINAFALPDGHLVIYSGLILNSDNQEELTGVICHEIAHIEYNHIMKKLVNEIGLSVVTSIITGSTKSDNIREILRILSSSSFDRSLEKEADIKAVDYLIKAKVNPEAFANFLYKLSTNKQTEKEYLTRVSSHPDSRERASYIIKYSKNKSIAYEAILSIKTWEKLNTELTKR